jgi:hypothetical protein
MLPDPWPALVMALAAYRLARLVGWDDFPPIHRLRARITGEQTVTSGSINSRMGVTNERPEVSVEWRRPVLAHFISCAFCQGFWISAAVYTAWLFYPTQLMYGLAPFALSGAVGIIARNLDP